MVEFFEKAEFRLFEQFRNAEITDEQKLRLHDQLQALEAHKLFFHKVLIDGKEAEKQKAAE